MKKPNYLSFAFLISLAACSFGSKPAPLREPSATNGAELPVILQKAREYLIQSPEFIKEEQKKVIAAVEAESP